MHDPEPDTMMIELTKLNRTFGDLKAIQDLDLAVPRGELFCFLGPNGAGKTTTIKILTGLLRPTSGTARIAGIDVQADPVATKRLIGYIPDMPFLYERLTASEFFAFTGTLYGIEERTVLQELDRLFDLFSLNEQRASLVKDLSHGMRQRLIYASTFLHDPRVLFIDEPLIGRFPCTFIINEVRSGVRFPIDRSGLGTDHAIAICYPNHRLKRHTVVSKLADFVASRNVRCVVFRLWKMQGAQVGILVVTVPESCERQLLLIENIEDIEE